MLALFPLRKYQFACRSFLFLVRGFQKRTTRVMRDHFLLCKRGGEDNRAIAASFETPLLDRRYEF